jgi:hypothetical protein
MSPATKRQPRQIADTDPIPVEQGVETWRNGSAGIVVINRVGEYGRRISDSIHGGRVFQITPQERRMNQGACALPTQDPFTNGTLHPQTLLDSEPDTAFLRENPSGAKSSVRASMPSRTSRPSPDSTKWSATPSSKRRSCSTRSSRSAKWNWTATSTPALPPTSTAAWTACPVV